MSGLLRKKETYTGVRGTRIWYVLECTQYVSYSLILLGIVGGLLCILVYGMGKFGSVGKWAWKLYRELGRWLSIL